MSFKVGDKVVCINLDGWQDAGTVDLVAGHKYTLTSQFITSEGELWIDYVKDWPEDFKLVEETIKSDYSTKHYDSYYHLTDKDIEDGKIKVDAYFVGKVWRTGSRDDSGALWHTLKTVARFGEKNSVEREIKALYNQAKALGRIYGVDLDD